MARRELEIRITVPFDNENEYIAGVYLEAMKAQVKFMEEHGTDIPDSGRHVFDEAVVWWCSRVVP